LSSPCSCAWLLPLLLTTAAAASQGIDCSISTEFQLPKSQVLSGVLQDPSGAPLGGHKMELLKWKKSIRRVRTGKTGAYDFGEIPPGKYRIRLRHAGGFCAPYVECGADRCTPRPRVKLKSVPYRLIQVSTGALQEHATPQ
jgi:hypothetical protein